MPGKAARLGEAVAHVAAVAHREHHRGRGAVALEKVEAGQHGVDAGVIGIRIPPCAEPAHRQPEIQRRLPGADAPAQLQPEKPRIGEIVLQRDDLRGQLKAQPVVDIAQPKAERQRPRRPRPRCCSRAAWHRRARQRRSRAVRLRQREPPARSGVCEARCHPAPRLEAPRSGQAAGRVRAVSGTGT